LTAAPFNRDDFFCEPHKDIVAFCGLGIAYFIPKAGGNLVFSQVFLYAGRAAALVLLGMLGTFQIGAGAKRKT